METQHLFTQEHVPDLAPGNVIDWEHRDYDDTHAYYSDATYREENDKDLQDNTREWQIQTDSQQQEDAPTDVDERDTVPIINHGEDLKAVDEAASIKEALQAYNKMYSLDAVKRGEQSPQLCAEMLLRIKEKFGNEMTPEQEEAIALQSIAAGHAIGHLAETPASEAVDQTSLQGLIDMAEIMDQAQVYAPKEVPLLEREILNVADKIDSRVLALKDENDEDLVKPVCQPIREALKRFNDEQQTKPFTKILTEIAYESLQDPVGATSTPEADSDATGEWSPLAEKRAAERRAMIARNQEYLQDAQAS